MTEPVRPGAPPEAETDDDRSARRVAHLAQIFEDHRAGIDAAHELHPTPAKKFTEMTQDEQKRWQMKQALVSDLNRRYHLAVRAAVAAHQAEDRELADRRATGIAERHRAEAAEAEARGEEVAR